MNSLNKRSTWIRSTDVLFLELRLKSFLVLISYLVSSAQVGIFMLRAARKKVSKKNKISHKSLKILY